MDLHAEAERLRLDTLAVAVSAELGRAAIPHVLLKGPSTALWLYDPPRRYRDVDLLVAPAMVEPAVRALQSAGIAFPQAGAAGEEAEHSMLLLSAEGFEVDLHLSLPTLPAGGPVAWDVLATHVETMDLGVGAVPVLDEPGRCLVLALHALNSGVGFGPPMEDLLRARTSADERSWDTAAALARRLGAGDLFWAGLALVDPAAAVGAGQGSTRARLYASGAPSAAIGLQRLSETGLRALPGAIAREIVPTTGFMRRAEPGRADGLVRLVWAYARRWGRLAKQLPSAIRAWRDAQCSG